MQLRPLRQTDPPKYPTREEFQTDAKQIFEHLPPRWRKVKGLLGAAIAVLAAQLGGCSAPVEKPIAHVTAASPPTVQAAAYWTRQIYGPHYLFHSVATPRIINQEEEEEQLETTPRY